MKISAVHVCAFLVVLFYAVGYYGFTQPEYSGIFEKLIPFHLLLMLVLMIISHEDRNRYFWIFLITAFAAGFLIELAGVKTGLIFGEYTYGSALGTKLADIPLLIGVNWILVIYSTGIVVKAVGVRNHIMKALIGACLITTLDVLIEPIAIKYDYWSWQDIDVPFQNYIGWFIFSFLMLRFFYLMQFRKSNFAAIVLFIMQFAFFFALNMKEL